MDPCAPFKIIRTNGFYKKQTHTCFQILVLCCFLLLHVCICLCGCVRVYIYICMSEKYWQKLLYNVVTDLPKLKIFFQEDKILIGWEQSRLLDCIKSTYRLNSRKTYICMYNNVWCVTYLYSEANEDWLHLLNQTNAIVSHRMLYSIS